jgi:hypothetical protein
VPGDDKTIRLKVVIDDDTRGADRAAKALEGTRKETEKLGTASEKAGKETEKLGEKTEGLGDKTEKAAHDTRTLDEEIKDLRAHVVQLGQAYDVTGDKSFLKQIRADRSQISQIEKIKKDLAEVETAAETAGGGLASLFKLNSEAFSAIPFKPILIGGLAGIAPFIVPALGAAVSGAVVGIGGVGGIAGGIASASRNPLVRSAAQKFGAEISSSFFGSEASVAFVKPTVATLGILSKDFKSLDLGGAFAKAAPSVETLAHGVGDLAKNAMPGFNRVMDKSGAISTTLAHGLAGTGDALSSFLTDAAESKGTIEGIRFTFAAVNDSVIALGHGLRWTGDRFHEYAGFATEASGALAHWLGWVPLLGDSLRDSNAKLNQFSDSGDGVVQVLHAFNPVAASATASLEQITGNTDAGTTAFRRYTVALQGATTALDDALDQRHALNDALLAEKQGWVDLTAALDHKQGLNLKEQQAIEQQAEALDRARRAAIAASDGSIAAQDKADAAYDKAIQRLLAMAKAAGATPAELAKIKADYFITLHIKSILEQTGGRGGPTYDSSDVAHQHAAHRAAVKLTLEVIHMTPDRRVIRRDLIDDALSRGVAQSVAAAAYP